MKKKVAYFSMEFAIDECLKTYSGGLGFLAGSHMRSVFELGQDVVGVGILWSYGYYDQNRDLDNNMRVDYIRKKYSFLEELDLELVVNINSCPVKVKVYYLSPDVFGTAPIYFLSTDFESNDYLSRTITHHLYDPNEDTRIAQSIILGLGGGKLIEALDYNPSFYHLNEAHALPLAFHLLEQFEDINCEKKKLVFTTHTPELAGNAMLNFDLLNRMGFFYNCSTENALKYCVVEKGLLNFTATALRLSHACNAVSDLHAKISQEMWEGYPNAAHIFGITNAQNQKYWQDPFLGEYLASTKKKKIVERKKALKKLLIQEVANQTGTILDPDVLTIVWARRFAGYKRAWLPLMNIEKFEALITNKKNPVQFIWAGKPYPHDKESIELFNWIKSRTDIYPNCAIVTGYELELSGLLKKGADVWLNTPRYGREASGTSGMSAAMNGSLNLSTNDGWITEFIKEDQNGFLIPTSLDSNSNKRDRDDYDAFYDTLTQKVIPIFYNDRAKWVQMMIKANEDVLLNFESGRMVDEYFDKLYSKNSNCSS